MELLKNFDFPKEFEFHYSDFTQSRNCQVSDTQFCCGDSKGELFLVDVKGERESVKFERTHKGQIFAIDCLEKKNLVASSCQDGSVCLWNLNDISFVKRWWEANKGVTSVVFSHASDIFASSSEDKFVRLYNFEKLKLIKTMQEHVDYVNTLTIDKERDIIFSGSFDGSVALIDVKNQKIISHIKYEDYIYSLCHYKEKNCLISGGLRVIHMTDLRKPKTPVYEKEICKDYIMEVIDNHSNLENSFIVGSDDESIAVYRCDDATLLNSVNVKMNAQGIFLFSGSERKQKLANLDLRERLEYLTLEASNTIKVVIFQSTEIEVAKILF